MHANDGPPNPLEQRDITHDILSRHCKRNCLNAHFTIAHSFGHHTCSHHKFAWITSERNGNARANDVIGALCITRGDRDMLDKRVLREWRDNDAFASKPCSAECLRELRFNVCQSCFKWLATQRVIELNRGGGNGLLRFASRELQQFDTARAEVGENGAALRAKETKRHRELPTQRWRRGDRLRAEE
jgi:hypothetical protein